MLLATYRQIKKLVILVVGLSVVLVGVALIVLPGPAIVVIPMGLAILATEFVWAKKLLKRMRQQVIELKDKVVNNGDKSDQN